MSMQNGFAYPSPAPSNVAALFDWSTPRRATVTVTPALAKEWLSARNTNNRNKKPNYITTLSNAMKEGRWIYDGTPIKFDRNGVLSDGQHRLAAIVLSGVSVVLDVVFGLDPAARLVHDTGVPRSTADIVKLISTIPQHTTQTAWFGTIYRIYRGFSARYDPSLVVSRYESWPSQMNWLVNQHKGTPVGVRAASIWAAFSLAITVDEDATREFVSRYVAADKLSRKDPALALREYALTARGAGGAHVSERSFRLAANALYANANGRPVALLKMSDEAMRWISTGDLRCFVEKTATDA